LITLNKTKMNNLIIIAAVSIDGVIGIDNNIPWKIPEDFKHYRETTMGNMVLVGYNTFLTLPPKAFEGREYMVLRGENPVIENRENLYQFKDLDTVLYLLQDEKTELKTVFVAGGAMVYDTLIDHCDRVVITWVNKTIPNGNKRFPIDKLFANFVVWGDENWQKSKTGEEYRITQYVRA